MGSVGDGSEQYAVGVIGVQVDSEEEWVREKECVGGGQVRVDQRRKRRG